MSATFYTKLKISTSFVKGSVGGLTHFYYVGDDCNAKRVTKCAATDIINNGCTMGDCIGTSNKMFTGVLQRAFVLQILNKCTVLVSEVE